MGSTCLGSPSESEGESVSEEAIQATEEVELSPNVVSEEAIQATEEAFH